MFNQNYVLIERKVEDTKGVIRSRNSKEYKKYNNHICVREQ